MIVEIGAFGVIKVSKLAPLAHRAGGHGGGVKTAGLSHHVGLSGLLDLIDQPLAFLQARGRGHRADDMFARVHRVDAIGHMERRADKERQTASTFGSRSMA